MDLEFSVGGACRDPLGIWQSPQDLCGEGRPVGL